MHKLMKTLLTLPALIMAGSLFAEEQAPAAPVEGQNMWQTVIMIGIAMVFFYFILWRPERKRRKAMEARRSSMKKGDRVTAMGIIGTIVRVQPETVILKMYDGAKIEVLKAAISDVQSVSDEEAAKTDKEETEAKV